MAAPGSHCISFHPTDSSSNCTDSLHSSIVFILSLFSLNSIFEVKKLVQEYLECHNSSKHVFFSPSDKKFYLLHFLTMCSRSTNDLLQMKLHIKY